ncbi:MAG: single-stranded-DNA-specific exonuclease RecJ [Pseudomonadota bacterium]
MQILPRPEKVAALFSPSVHPVLRRIFSARGVQQEAELDLTLADLLSPYAMLNMAQATEVLWQALCKQQQILIVADFDADGATSCALAILCLRAMGFTAVQYLVPNRFEYGYGLTPEIVEVARTYNPDLIITVDNGIASHAGIALARSLGIDVLVTDHHLPAATLPDASCILNPNQPDCTFPSKALAGVGVVFYLMSALRAHLRKQDWFTTQGLPEPKMSAYLDLVALGTVADVVPLDRNNRILVKNGLHFIRSGRCRPGILALLEVAGKNAQNIVAVDLGFIVGPRLNAAGRLDDMSVGIECLLADDAYEARELALQLDGLNKDRRLIEQGMQIEALSHLQRLSLDDEPRHSICLYDPAWHQGVIGILAARIKERLHRPVIIFADGGEDSDGKLLIKGSARSIPGIHIRDLLDTVATRNPALLTKFGGHAMAAGLTIYQSDFAAFCAALEQVIQQHTGPELFLRHNYTDGQLGQDCFSLEFATLLRDSGPWGQHFPEPVFDGEFTIIQKRVLGDKHLKLVLQGSSGETYVDAIAFNVDQAILHQDAERAQLLYKLDINEYRGNYAVQLIVEKLEFL